MLIDLFWASWLLMCKSYFLDVLFVHLVECNVFIYHKICTPRKVQYFFFSKIRYKKYIFSSNYVSTKKWQGFKNQTKKPKCKEEKTKPWKNKVKMPFCHILKVTMVTGVSKWRTIITRGKRHTNNSNKKKKKTDIEIILFFM